jgi:uridine phosphorylase
MLLTQFDPARRAVINPEDYLHPIENFPETVVSIFSHELFNAILNFLGGKKIAESRDVDGYWPIYEVTYQGKRLAMCKARLGAPACVGCFEELIAFGAKRIILLGNCGVLDKNIRDCCIIIPTRAIRDEGTSYHYAPAADFIDVNKKYIPEFKAVCDQFGYPYVEGTTWTTDAFYRETAALAKERLKQGCIAVEMECASLMAVGKFREREIYQFLYAADSLSGEAWNARILGRTPDDLRRTMLKIALDAAAALTPEEKG